MIQTVCNDIKQTGGSLRADRAKEDTDEVGRAEYKEDMENLFVEVGGRGMNMSLMLIVVMFFGSIYMSKLNKLYFKLMYSLFIVCQLPQ